MIDKKTQGKKNRQAGARFELKVRKDLEGKGWIVAKWMNNVEEVCYANKNGEMEVTENCSLSDALKSEPKFPIRKLIPAKRKYNPFNKALGIGTGFPDFIAFRHGDSCDCGHYCGHIDGVEVKSNGYLSKEEKEKCKWYLDNEIFSKILIAKKGKKKGTIEYMDFVNYNN